MIIFRMISNFLSAHLFYLFYAFADYVRPVCLPYGDSDNETYKDKQLIVAGFGHTKVVPDPDKRGRWKGKGKITR